MAQGTTGGWAFEHAAGFQAGELSGNLQLDAYEEIYQKLFAEVLEDGVITAEERVRLEKAAASLGLDRGRLEQLEKALTAGYEVLYGRRVVRADVAPAAVGAALSPNEAPFNSAGRYMPLGLTFTTPCVWAYCSASATWTPMRATLCQ
jgi:hypothetical protein